MMEQELVHTRTVNTVFIVLGTYDWWLLSASTVVQSLCRESPVGHSSIRTAPVLKSCPAASEVYGFLLLMSISFMHNQHFACLNVLW